MTALRAFAGRLFARPQADRDRAASWLLSSYLGVAAAYWLPGLDRELLDGLKVAAWVAGTGLVIVPAAWEGRLRIPRGILGPGAFAAVVLLSVPGLVRASDGADIARFVVDIGAGAAFLWCFFDLARRGFDLPLLFLRAALVGGALSALSLGIVVFGIPDLNVPCRILHQMPATTGFGIRRTGWSIGIGLLLPALALAAGLPGSRRSRAVLVAAAIGAAAIPASQFASGGRTGLAMSGMAVLVFLLGGASRRLALALVAAGFVLSWTVLDASCLRHLRIPVDFAELRARETSPAWWSPRVLRPHPPTVGQAFTRGLAHARRTGYTLDFVSGHRIRQLELSVERIADRPLAGHGWRQVLFHEQHGDRLVEAHNLWLRWALYTGLPAPVWFAFLALSILAAAVRLACRLRRTEHAGLAGTLALIVFLGLFASLFEGSVLVGSFHLTAIWWGAGGAALGFGARLRERERAERFPPARKPPPNAARAPIAPGESPPVSIVVPARNAEETLPATLEAALSQDYGGAVEIVVADGSDTRATAELLGGRFPEVRRVENPERTTPSALNRALAAASHRIVVRCDAHAVFPPDYLARAVETLARTGAANVGGRQIPVGRTPFERAVALGTSTLLGAGGARWRMGGREGPAHTVYLGAFRREALEAVGGFDPSLARNQDYDLNWRLREAGETVWFDPALSAAYRPRSDLPALARQYFQYGWWKRIVLDRYPESNRARFWPAPLLLAGLAGSGGAALLGSLLPLVGGGAFRGPVLAAAAVVPVTYLGSLLLGSLLTGLRRRDAAALLLPVVLSAMHLCWGAGFWLSGWRRVPPEALRGESAGGVGQTPAGGGAGGGVPGRPADAGGAA